MTTFDTNDAKKHNDAVVEFLIDYVRDKVESQYAVLLKGAWGSGKTHFVEKMRMSLGTEDIKSIRISLFGLRTTKAIDSAIFKQIHPLLGSKGAQLFASILKGIAKTAIKVDIDDALSVEAEISSLDLKPQDIFPGSKGFVFIFDDIERCLVKPLELLGYINHFIETQKQRVILVANEDKIHSKAYRLTREKVVGAIVSVRPDYQSAIRNFAAEVCDDLLEPHLSMINEVIASSGYENLRHIRQLFISLNRVCIHLNRDLTKNAPLMSLFLYGLSALYIEFRQGALDLSMIEKMRNRWAMALDDSDSKTRLAKELTGKYSKLNESLKILSSETWMIVVEQSQLDFSKLNAQLKSFSTVTTKPLWNRLWEWSSLDDKAISKLVNEGLSELQVGSFNDPREAVQIFGVFTELRNHGLSGIPVAKTEKLVKKHLDVFFASGQCLGEYDRGVAGQPSWAGHVYQGLNSSNSRMAGVLSYMDGQQDSAVSKLAAKNADILIAALEIRDVAGFVSTIHGRGSDIDLRREFFPKSSGKRFAKAFADLPARESHQIRDAMEYRYKSYSFSGEQDFLGAVIKELKVQAKNRHGTISGRTCANAIKAFEDFLI